MTAATSPLSAQNIASTILQQLLSGGNAQATGNLPPALLEDALRSTTSAQTFQTGTQASSPAPAAILQAMGALLAGSADSAKGSLAQLQSYFGQNPAGLASLMGSLQGGTYSAAGTVTGAQAPASVTQALGNLLGGAGGASESTDLATVQNYFQQTPASLASALSALRSGTAGTGSSSAAAILQVLAGSSAKDPLVAAIGGSTGSSSSSGSAFSMFG